MTVFESYRETVWQAWYNKEGPCGQCPAHSPKWSPAYAGGDPDARVMLVLSDPNNTRQSDKPHYSNPEDRDSKWSYGYSADNGWNMMDYLNPIVDAFEGEDHTNADDIYFTNAHKCPTISEDPFKQKDRKSRKQCQKFLPLEIEFVDPDVVIALSNQAIKAVGSVPFIGFDGNKGATEYVREWTVKGKRTYGKDPAVVAGVHPSTGKLHLHLEKDWYGDNDHNKWYRQQLARSVKEGLSN